MMESNNSRSHIESNPQPDASSGLRINGTGAAVTQVHSSVPNAVQTPTTDMDLSMQQLSLDQGSPASRPYPLRTSSQVNNANSVNGSARPPPPSGPLPQIPRSGGY
jgi:hypothetical protein